MTPPGERQPGSTAWLASLAVVASTDDAQAGLGFIYAPLIGVLVAGAAVLLDRLTDRRASSA